MKRWALILILIVSFVAAAQWAPTLFTGLMIGFMSALLAEHWT